MSFFHPTYHFTHPAKGKLSLITPLPELASGKLSLITLLPELASGILSSITPLPEPAKAEITTQIHPKLSTNN